MVSQVLKEAGIFDLLEKHLITRMPTIPTDNYDDQPDMVEISSEEEEGQDDDPSAPPVRGSRRTKLLERLRRGKRRLK